MKFNEKLQYLRKEQKLSQEQLADMLEVSRQAVSKWESGQTYPEMDKLLSICKIFKCKLEDLTNDEIKEITPNSKHKNNINNIIEEIAEIFNKSIDMFKAMDLKSIIKFVFTIILIFMFFAIFKIPVNHVNDLGRNLFYSFGDIIGNVFSSIWNFTLEIGYFIVCVVAFVYFYKSQYLDKLENFERQEELNEEIPNKDIKDQKYKEKIVKVKKENMAVFDVLIKISIYLIKFVVVCISVPFIFILFALFASLAIIIILTFKGVVYIGVLLAIIFSIFLSVVFLELIFNFLNNKKNQLIRVFIMFLISISGLGISSGILALEIANTDFYLESPSSEILTTNVIEYQFDKEMYLETNFHSGNLSYVEDNTLENTIKFEIKNYEDFTKTNVINNKNKIDINRLYIDVPLNKILNIIIADLSKKQLHDYSILYSSEITIYSSAENIERLKLNTEEYEQRQIEQNNLNATQYYQDLLNDKEEELEELIDEFNNIKNENDLYKNKIQEYKDRLNELMGL